MAQASRQTSIAELRLGLERTEGHGPAEGAALPFGVAAIDRGLPRGGLARRHEVMEGGSGERVCGSAALFVAVAQPTVQDPARRRPRAAVIVARFLQSDGEAFKGGPAFKASVGHEDQRCPFEIIDAHGRTSVCAGGRPGLAGSVVALKVRAPPRLPK
jgi:hypothetical protein